MTQDFVVITVIVARCVATQSGHRGGQRANEAELDEEKAIDMEFLSGPRTETGAA